MAFQALIATTYDIHPSDVTRATKPCELPTEADIFEGSAMAGCCEKDSEADRRHDPSSLHTMFSLNPNHLLISYNYHEYARCKMEVSIPPQQEDRL